jgi:serine/threonine-protein phosphatase PGAM5
MPVKMTRVFCSDFRRARETADDIAAILGLAAARDTLLRECTPSTDREDIMKREKSADVATCEARLDAAWKAHMVPATGGDQHDVLVCHGNVIRWWVARTVGMDMKRWLSMDIGNGSLTVVAVRSDGTPRLVSYSDVGHIPVDVQTWSGRGAGWNARDKR